ncbi:hypothetical protein TRICI_001950 [Trichomonascus ciferrii]|uniref:SHSP domain-containing protein n=1 Tax=Trichomonascus ciferrii TaxID=44093 RepID=A0A642V9G7_9ASCO|nr:hypothetical protein TRICI_001950 [Trichomonascus ciferrii]
MSLRVYNPFYDFFDSFDNLFPDRGLIGKQDEGQKVLNRPNNWVNSVSPQIDLYDKPEGYEVVASVPGISGDKLKIDFDPNTRILSISGEDYGSIEADKEYLKYQERWSGTFQRSIAVPRQGKLFEEDITAALNNGILKVRIPKEAAEENKPEKKRIQVKVQDSPLTK